MRATRWWHWVRWPLAIGSGLFTVLFLGLVVLYFTVKLPDRPPQLSSSVILDDQGREIAVLAKDGLRFDVSLDHVAPIVPVALVAAEDRRFYEHGGLDPVGLARAFVNDLRGGATQGGSTITQQLVKNSYLNGDRSLVRKVKEAILAVKLERRDDKRSILERYLNIVYFGRGAYGIEAAARVYFDTTAAQLRPAQAALLIGLLRAPESADPTANPAEAKRRRDTVLQDLVDTNKMSKADADAAKAEPLGATAVEHPVTLSAGVGAHFVEWVRQQAVNKFGAAAVYGGGLKIHTTLDLDAQHAAEAAVAKVLPNPDDPQAALVATDRDGNIRAYVGGRDFNTLKVDLARGRDGGGSGRQPGSAFKPFTLATALEKNIPLGTTFPAPATITLPTTAGPWTVNNFDNEQFGVTDLTTATAHSINTVYAQLMLQAVPKDVAALAKRAGITSPLEPNPSLTLGTDEVAPLEMSDSYLTFARDGEHVPTISITSVEDSTGKVLFKPDTPTPERAIAEGPARAVNYALQHVIADGTGTAAKLDRPAAGKTGTTQDYRDAWFAGYTPNYVATVWVGFPEGSQHTMNNVQGAPVTGGSLPAQIWKAFMDQALTNVPKVDFAPPPPELLQAPDLATNLTLNPTAGPAGTTVTGSGSGFERCVAAWYLTLDTGAVTTAPQTGSSARDRSAAITVPVDAAPGPHTLQAVCDQGTGPRPAGQATFTVNAAVTTTTEAVQPPQTRPPPSSAPTTTAPNSSTTTTTAAPTTTVPSAN